MNESDVIHHLRLLAEDASHILIRYNSEVLRLLETNVIADPKVRFILNQLAVSIHCSSESALLLVSFKRLWDSEMLVRSAWEGTTKFVYMSSGSPLEREQRVREYWDDGLDIEAIRKHERASAFLEDVSDPEANKWQAFRELLLDDKTLKELRKRYPRILRQQINHRWSFNELVKRFAQDDSIKAQARERFPHLIHGYGMGSHLIHQDAIAVGIVNERIRRSDERRLAIETAHGGRLVLDILACVILRTQTARALCGESDINSDGCDQDMSAIMEKLNHASAEWNRIEYAASRLG